MYIIIIIIITFTWFQYHYIYSIHLVFVFSWSVWDPSWCLSSRLCPSTSCSTAAVRAPPSSSALPNACPSSHSSSSSSSMAWAWASTTATHASFSSASSSPYLEMPFWCGRQATRTLSVACWCSPWRRWTTPEHLGSGPSTPTLGQCLLPWGCWSTPTSAQVSVAC